MPCQSLALCTILFLVLTIYVMIVILLSSVDLNALIGHLVSEEVVANVLLIAMGAVLMLIGQIKYHEKMARAEAEENNTPSFYEDVTGVVIVDLDKLVTLMTCRNLPPNSRRPKFNWNDVTARCGAFEYKCGLDTLSRCSRALYSKSYSNPSDVAVAQPLTLTRSTVSTIELSILKTFTFNGVMHLDFSSMKLASGAALDPVFADELNRNKGLFQTAEHVQVWQVNTEFSVPPKSKVTVQLEVEEETFEGSFEMLVTIDGTVQVSQGDSRVCALSLLKDLSNVIPDEGLSTDDEGRLTYLVRGLCKYKLILGHTLNKIVKPLGSKQEKNANC